MCRWRNCGQTWVRSSSGYHRGSKILFKTCIIQFWTPGFNWWNPLTSWCETQNQDKLWTSPLPHMQTMWPRANFSKIGKSSSRSFVRKTWPSLTSFRDSVQLSTLARLEHTASMRCQGSWADKQRMYIVGFLTGLVATSTKYLGSWLHHEERQAQEITFRINVAQEAWSRMRVFGTNLALPNERASWCSRV